uniref:Uncharacterized protein n=1 Tax=Onchocerca volvulus TaxID=6282 RepID=A0A8R1XP20_ONCVO
MVAPSFHIVASFLIIPSTCLEKNVTIMLDIRDEHHKIVKCISALLFTVSLPYGITSNILMATVLFCGRKDNSYSRAFILIASQLIISNLLAFLPQLIVVLLGILQNETSPYVNQMIWINYIFTILLSFSQYVLVTFFISADSE